MTTKASMSSRPLAEYLGIKVPERTPLTYILWVQIPRNTTVRIENIVVLHSNHMRRSLTELAADILVPMGLITVAMLVSDKRNDVVAQNMQ